MNNSSTHFASCYISIPNKTLKQVQGDVLQSGCNKLNPLQPVIASISEAIQKRKSPMQTKKAFTLAEIMIVLMVIGILTAILLPSARNATPNKDILKFKKAHNTFHTAISELVNSDEYYSNGDLGLKSNGSLVDNPKYFCNTLADIMNVKKTNCSESNLGYNSSAVANLPDIGTDELDGQKIYDLADCMCLNNTSAGEEIVLGDGSVIYSVNPYYHFGSMTESGGGSEGRIFNLCSKEQRYKYVCVDIDGIGKGEAPFGYALRADGKIFSGSRALAWINKNIQEKDDSINEAISSVDSCSPNSLVIESEDEMCSGNTSPCGKFAVEITADGKKMCIMKYNAGDDAWNATGLEEAKVLALPLTISTTSVGSATCAPSETNFCCITGATAPSCDSTNGNYSGCNRTVCDWRAANEYCSTLSYQNLTWRLPTEAEWNSIGSQLSSLQFNRGTNGLMFCDSQSGYSSTWCAKNESCTGSYFTACYPYSYWSAETSGNKANNIDLEQGTIALEMQNKGLTVSVRCVAEL